MFSKRNAAIVGTLLSVVAIVAVVTNRSGNAAPEQRIALEATRSDASAYVIHCTKICDRYAAPDPNLLAACKYDCANKPEPKTVSQCNYECDKTCLGTPNTSPSACQADCKAGCSQLFGGRASKAEQCLEKLSKEAVAASENEKDFSEWMDAFSIADDSMFVSGNEILGKKQLASDAATDERVRSEMAKMCTNLGSKHTTFRSGSDRVWLLYEDNAAILADVSSCEVKGVFLANSDGSMNTIVAAKINKLKKGAKMSLSRGVLFGGASRRLLGEDQFDFTCPNV